MQTRRNRPTTVPIRLATDNGRRTTDRSDNGQRTTDQPRSGFTLLELLMVIAIIAILIALLLPAVNSVRRNLRIAQVKTEISNLETALNDFKAHYKLQGYPPSRIVLHELPAGWTNNPKDLAVMRRIFGIEFDPNWQDKDASGTLLPGRDIDGDGTADLDPDGDGQPGITLTSSEALCFWLGGVWQEDPPGSRMFIPLGFSRNKANPLSRQGQSRVGPFFERFSPGRLRDADGDKFPEFVDTLPGQNTPYHYVASLGSSYPDPSKFPNPPALFYYKQGNSSQPFNPKSFQIISPGYDGQHYDVAFFQQNNLAPILSLSLEQADSQLLNFRPNGPNRLIERDNIANFSDGTFAD